MVPTVLSYAPYAFWRLNDAPGSTVARDSAANGRHGAVLASAPTWGDTSHTVAPAAEFTATNQNLLAPWAQNAPTVDDWLVEMWVRPQQVITIHAQSGSGTAATGGTNSWACYPVNSVTTAYAGAGLSVGQNGLVVAAHSSGVASTPCTVATAISGAVLSHVAVRCVARVPSAYVNGVLVKTGVASNRAVYMPTQVGCEGANLGGVPVGAEIAEVAWFTGTGTGPGTGGGAAGILARYQAGLTNLTWELWTTRNAMVGS